MLVPMGSSGMVLGARSVGGYFGCCSAGTQSGLEERNRLTAHTIVIPAQRSYRWRCERSEPRRMATRNPVILRGSPKGLAPPATTAKPSRRDDVVLCGNKKAPAGAFRIGV